MNIRSAEINPIEKIESLPNNPIAFLLKNIGPLKKEFWFYTFLSTLSAVLSFGAVWIFSEIFSNIDSITIENIFPLYILPFILLTLLSELMDYFIRRYSEQIPERFGTLQRVSVFKNIFKR